MSPQVTPGYYECPRCGSRNAYFAKRSFGQIGNLIDLPSGVGNPAFGVNIEKDVALCFECRERMNWIKEVVKYSSEEQKAIDNRAAKAGWFIAPFGLLFFLLMLWGGETLFAVFFGFMTLLGAAMTRPTKN